MSENFDVVVIGAGPAGYVAAIRAAQLNQKVAIVDKQWLGGVCLNVGCIPSKSLLKNAEVAHTLRERAKDFGFSFDNLKLDYSVAVKRSRQNSDRLVKGVGFLMRKNNITVFMGTAHLTKPTVVTVTDKDGKLTELVAKNIIVATGASAAVPPVWKVDGEKVLTYSRSHFAGKTSQECGHHRLGRNRRGIRHSLEFIRCGCDHRRNAAAYCSA